MVETVHVAEGELDAVVVMAAERSFEAVVVMVAEGELEAVVEMVAEGELDTVAETVAERSFEAVVEATEEGEAEAPVVVVEEVGTEGVVKCSGLSLRGGVALVVSTGGNTHWCRESADPDEEKDPELGVLKTCVTGFWGANKGGCTLAVVVSCIGPVCSWDDPIPVATTAAEWVWWMGVVTLRRGVVATASPVRGSKASPTLAVSVKLWLVRLLI